jgi:putative ABC transport system permease protein
MFSLARAILIYEWRRFFPAVLAVAFAGLLVLVQFGLLLGMFSAVSVYIDRSSADLWVGFPGTPSIDQARPIPEKVENQLRMDPDVTHVERYTWTLADWKRPCGGRLSATLIGITSEADSMTFSRLLSPHLKQLLLDPGNVLVDESDLGKLGVKVGDYTELQGKRIHVAGTVRGMRSIGGVNVISSLTTARTINKHLQDNAIDYFLVKISDPTQAEKVRDRLQPSGSFQQYQVWTAKEFANQSIAYWLFESGAGGGFMFSSLLGFIVGVVITSQTLMAAIVSALREYATLRALGVSSRSLSAVVLEQSFWIGVTGLCIATLVSVLIAAGAEALYVNFTIPPAAAMTVLLLVMAITLLSGLSALRALNRADPFVLLR